MNHLEEKSKGARSIQDESWGHFIHEARKEEPFSRAGRSVKTS